MATITKMLRALALCWLLLISPAIAGDIYNPGASSMGDGPDVDNPSGSNNGPPVLAFGGNGGGNGSNNPQVISGISIGSAAATREIIVTWTVYASSDPVSSISIIPNVGSTVTATIDAQQSAAAPTIGIAHAILLADANTATTVTVNYTFSGGAAFATLEGGVWYAPSAGFNSTTPIGGAGQVGGPTATTTTVSTTLTTQTNGFIVAAAGSTGLGTGTFSGTASYTNDFSTTTGLLTHAGGHSGATTSTGSNTVTATFTVSGTAAVVAAAWR